MAEQLPVATGTSAATRRLAWAVAVILVAWTATPAAALTPDDIALVVNRNVPQSVELAEFYAQQRNIPEGRIIRLDLPGSEEISFNRYERDVVPPVRRFLREHGLEEQVKCLVTFYGVPFRVAPRRLSAQEKAEFDALTEDLRQVGRIIEPIIEQAETLARELEPGFEPPEGADMESLARRADAALQTAARALNQTQDADQRRVIFSTILTVLQQLAGPAAVMQRFGEAELNNPLQAPEQRQRWLEMRDQLAAAAEQSRALQDQRYDPDARAALRQLIAEQFGLFGFARLIKGQIEYFGLDQTTAALDSELALLWWDHYPRSKWQPNPLHYGLDAEKLGTPPVIMVMRLDGPQAETARNIIVASLQAEREGLRGKVVIDSRGIPLDDREGRPDGYGHYDQTLRDLAELIREKTDLKLLFDESPDVLPANSARDVALYCGWYSLRRYVPACHFVPGAVGFHVASLEMVRLRAADERGWVRGLLNDGIASTMGAVAEPYLHSFPRADEFFALLLTGELTLAEVYWLTTPLTSWMVSVIGDPLYTPYKNNPVLRIEDLPESLRPIFDGR